MRVGKAAPKNGSMSIPAAGPSLLREADWRLPSGSTLAEFALQAGFLAFRLRDTDSRQGAVDCFPVWPGDKGFRAGLDCGDRSVAVGVRGQAGPSAAAGVRNGAEDSGFLEDSAFTVPPCLHSFGVQEAASNQPRENGQPRDNKVKTDR